jgi:uncharacterized protein
MFTLLLKAFVILAAAYLGFAALVFLLQDRLLFLPGIPGREIVTTPADHGMPFEDLQLVTDDGESLHGWWVPAAADPRGAVLIFHGNAGNISHRAQTLRIWHDLGYDALIFDYRGYGRSSGRPSERGTYADARAAWRHLVDERALPGDRDSGDALGVEGDRDRLARHVVDRRHACGRIGGRQMIERLRVSCRG